MTPAPIATAGPSFPSNGNLHAPERKELWQPPPGPCMNHQDNVILDCARGCVPESMSQVRGQQQLPESKWSPPGLWLFATAQSLWRSCLGQDHTLWELLDKGMVQALFQQVVFHVGNQKENNLPTTVIKMMSICFLAPGRQPEREKLCAKAADGWSIIKAGASQVSSPLALHYRLFCPLFSLSLSQFLVLTMIMSKCTSASHQSRELTFPLEFQNVVKRPTCTAAWQCH